MKIKKKNKKTSTRVVPTCWFKCDIIKTLNTNNKIE